jgi:uncharacterized phage-associated protein
MGGISAQNVADYFLAQMSDDCGDTISNLKLQKLLYYAQGVNLAFHDTPLFRDRIRAWDHGPVIPSIYHKYKEYGDGAIPKPNNVNFAVFTKKDRTVMDEVWKVFGQFSAWKLRNMTHAEPPWKNTERDAVIPRAAMREYFKTLLVS